MVTENLAAFLADFGSPLTWNGVTATPPVLAIFDQPDTDILSKRVQSRGYKITFLTSTLPNIARNDTIIVKGLTLKVLEANSIGDGIFSYADLTT